MQEGEDVNAAFKRMMDEHNERILRTMAVPTHQMSDHSGGVTRLQPGERVIRTRDDFFPVQCYQEDYSIHQSPFEPFKTEWYPRKRKPERWHSWKEFKRHHRDRLVAMLNESHYRCIPLTDLREAVSLSEPSWRERHWRGLYVAKWAGGIYLFLQLLRV